MARRRRRLEQRQSRPEQRRRDPPATPSRFPKISSDWLVGGLVLGVVVIASVIFLVAQRGGKDGEGIRPLFAQVFSLAVSPSGPNTLFLGDVKGMFRSTDGGREWRSYAFAGQEVRAILNDPSDPNLFLAATGTSLHRSVDGGARWDILPSDLPAGGVLALAADPADSRKMYAFVAGNGLYRSDDGGGRWAQVNPAAGANITSLAIKPGEPSVLYLFHTIQGFSTSKDGGRSLQRGGGGVPTTSVTGLLTFAAEPETVFAVAGRTVYKSADGGARWEPVNQGLEDVQAIAMSRDSASGDLYVTDVQGEIHRSGDGGASWS